MPQIDDIRIAMQAMTAGRLASHAGLRLKEVIALLSAAPPEAKVYFDFCDLVPDGVDSYRGYYSDLAVGWAANGEAPTCAGFLARMQACVGATFEGYKGGDFTMGPDTPVWVANYGRSHGTAIVRITWDDYAVTLHTGKVDD